MQAVYKSRLLATIALAATFLLVFVALTTADTLTVTVPWANVREGPGADYQALTTVRRGSIFPILGTKKGWHRIGFPDGREGWISGSIVQVTKERRGIAVDPVSLPLATEQFYRSSWALVIGIDRYPHPKIPSLRYAVNDARSVKAALEDLGFPSHQIFVLLNEKATKRSIEKVLYDRLRDVGKEDRLFVFFAGHGETEQLPRGGSEGFLLPYDAATDNLFLTAISMSDVKRMGR